jgi:hypothetical protein
VKRNARSTPQSRGSATTNVRYGARKKKLKQAKLRKAATIPTVHPAAAVAPSTSSR